MIGDVIALAVRDRHADHLSRVIAPRERRIGALDAQIDVATYEFERRVAHQHARQKSGFAQDLEAVAYPEHEPAARSMSAHRRHDRRPRRNRAATEIIAVGKTTGYHDEVGLRG